MIVVDASVMVEALAGRGQCRDRLRDEDIAAPHLIDAEVGHVIRRSVRTGEVAAARAEAMLEALTAFEIVRMDHRPLIRRAWELRENLSFYDGLYVSLAEALDANLITLDGRLARAPGLNANIEVVAGS